MKRLVGWRPAGLALAVERHIIVAHSGLLANICDAEMSLQHGVKPLDQGGIRDQRRPDITGRTQTASTGSLVVTLFKEQGFGSWSSSRAGCCACLESLRLPVTNCRCLSTRASSPVPVSNRSPIQVSAPLVSWG